MAFLCLNELQDHELDRSQPRPPGASCVSPRMPRFPRAIKVHIEPHDAGLIRMAELGHPRLCDPLWAESRPDQDPRMKRHVLRSSVSFCATRHLTYTRSCSTSDSKPLSFNSYTRCSSSPSLPFGKPWPENHTK